MKRNLLVLVVLLLGVFLNACIVVHKQRSYPPPHRYSHPYPHHR